MQQKHAHACNENEHAHTHTHAHSRARAALKGRSVRTQHAQNVHALATHTAATTYGAHTQTRVLVLFAITPARHTNTRQ